MTTLELSGPIVPKAPHCSNAISSAHARSEEHLEAIADEFETHMDFSTARADGLRWDFALLDGLAA